MSPVHPVVALLQATPTQAYPKSQATGAVLHAPAPSQVPAAWALVPDTQFPPQSSPAWVWQETPSAAHSAFVPQAASTQFTAQHWLAIQLPPAHSVPRVQACKLASKHAPLLQA